MSTVKYGTVWCGNERDSVAAYGRLYYSKQLASFFIAFLSTGSLPMGGVLLFIIDIKLGLPWDLTKVSGRWEVIYVMSKKLWKPLHELTLAHFSLSQGKQVPDTGFFFFQDSRMKMIPVINPKST